ALFPGNYDAGVMLAGGWRLARYAVAVMDGAPAGDAPVTGRDPTAAPGLLRRAGVHGPGDDRRRGRGGPSALGGARPPPGTPPTTDQVTWVDANEDGMVQPTELMVIPGAPGTPSQTFDREALGADVAVAWCAGELGHGEAFAEAAIATNLDRAVIVAD